ncbi:opioid growth factor receptor isoform X2 [Dendrobates tinctorius]|uniref:opioid growth factor receptor isoform X2 n=1 Tax=Dendrobates tinctorius TaxID=92724 RepID=UPI003CC9C713
MSRDGGEDGWTSEYDSTWEEDGEEVGRKQERARERRTHGGCRHNYSQRWRNKAARDMQRYRHGYRGDQSCTRENSETMYNLEFYQNKRCFEPNGLYIEELLKDWKDDYNTLERNHSYIQWLFPLREYGMNSCAKPLTQSEIKLMKEDNEVKTRFLKAYKLMLQFYGITLFNEQTGELRRAGNCEERFKNLNCHSHNNLRITRILKCLGEMGYERFQAPLVMFFLEATLCNNQLPNVKRSVLEYFMFAVKDKQQRRKLVHFAWEKYKQNNQQDRFIWGPVDKLRHYRIPDENYVNVSSGGFHSDTEKNLHSKTYKNQNMGQKLIKVHESGRSRSNEALVNQCDSKIKRDITELIPMKDKGGLPDNDSNHNKKASPDQSHPLIKDPNSFTGLVEDQIEKNDVKKEENIDCEDAKVDPSKENIIEKVQEEEVKGSEHDQVGGVEVNGLSNCVQNTENKFNQGEHNRKRKMPDCNPMNSQTDSFAAADTTLSSHNICPCQAEGAQVIGVEEDVKKLKLDERLANDYANGFDEENIDHDVFNPRELGNIPAMSGINCNIREHS